MQIIEALQTSLEDALHFLSCQLSCSFSQKGLQRLSNYDLIVSVLSRRFPANKGESQFGCKVHLAIELYSCGYTYGICDGNPFAMRCERESSELVKKGMVSFCISSEDLVRFAVLLKRWHIRLWGTEWKNS